MATTRYFLRSTEILPSSRRIFSRTLRFASSSSESPSLTVESNSSLQSGPDPQELQHAFLPPNSFIGSWVPPPTPDEAQRKLALIRRQYAQQVKQLRKQYIYEVEQQGIRKLRKEEARREAMRLANEQRKVEKTAISKVKEAERKAFEEEFRQTLLKERGEKLENWRQKERLRKEKEKEKHELIRRQSSMWIDEGEMEKKIMEVVVDSSSL